MPRRCAFGCKPSDVPMHRFPNLIKFPEIFQSWVSLVGGKLESTSDYEYYKDKRICDIHFTDKDRAGNNRICKESIPSLHIPGQLPDPKVLEQTSTSVQQTQSIQLNATEQLEDACTLHDKEISKHILFEHNYCITNNPRRFKGKASYNIVPLNAKIRQLRSTISRLRKKGQSFQTRLRNAEMLSKTVSFQNVTRNMTKSAQLFVQMQMQTLKKPKGRRFSNEEKVLSLSLYKKSPKCYALLNKYFTLPSAKTMKRLLYKIKISPGINTVIFQKIRKTMSGKPLSDRLCSLMFDEMSLTPHLQYDSHNDLLEGFATNNGKLFANHVLVFMVKGVKENYKQPIAYYFTNSLNKIQLKNIIKSIVKHAQEAGLVILNTVCDQSTVNVGAITELIKESRALFIKDNKEWRHDLIYLNGKSIIPIYDVPHLIKGIRNNLLNKDMLYSIENEEKLVKWEYFQKVYEADKSLGELRLLNKLTEEHINPEKINKMKVKTATQIFSHTVAVATEHLTARSLLQLECKNLIKITLLFDKLFDTLNGNTLHIPNGKIYKGPVKKYSPHHKMWQDAKIILKTIKFRILKKNGDKIRLIETSIPSVQNLIKTIEGMEAIWKNVNERYGFDALLTRNLNQDPIENFFGNIRSYGVRNIMPSTVGFVGAYKALLLNNYNSPHSSKANCEEDGNRCLQSLHFFLTEENKQDSNVPKEEIRISDNIFDQHKQIDAGQRNYVCGWVLKKCLENIVKSCKDCRQNLLDSGTNVNNEFIKRKEYGNKKWLCYPSQELEDCFSELQNITVKYLEKNCPRKNVKENILNLAECIIEYPFDCQIHKEKLKKYFVHQVVNILIYSWCRAINRILSGKISYVGDDETKTAAQLYYNKYKLWKNKK
ncbi:unnamed protein product [Euphydryas editha]|uniref:THAP-type domain-containing protein n=1 Tax=Euphydryas editha TaxID=104508 RepID=A0AAU9TMR6_EUPED|nr:unnamed protein product [Euphydryas editha]